MMMNDEAMILFFIAAIGAVILAWMDGRWRVLNSVWRAVSWLVRRWKYFAITFAAACFFVVATSRHPDEEFFIMGLISVGILAVAAWGREFVQLMTMSDDAFPGKSDKLVWGLALIFLPPIGAILFHRYRTKNNSARKPVSFELS